MKRNGLIVGLLVVLGLVFTYTSQQLHQHTIDTQEIEGVRELLTECQASHGSIKGAATAASHVDAQALDDMKVDYEAKLKKVNEELQLAKAELSKRRSGVEAGETGEAKAAAVAAAPPPPSPPAAPPPPPAAPPASTTNNNNNIVLGKPLQPVETKGTPVVKLPPPRGHDPWFRCMYYSGMTNNWYGKTESEKIKVPQDLPQEKKFYVDIAVLAAKKHLKADSATPTLLEEWGATAYPGYNGMVDVTAGGQEVSVSFTHDMLDEPKVHVEQPKSGRKVIFSVCEQNRASDWARFVKEVAQMDKSTFTLCLTRWPGNPVDHQGDMKANGVDGIVIDMKGEFSRAGGLDACARSANYADDDIILTTDIDVQMPQDAITAARKYVSLGRRSYFMLGPGSWNIQATGLGAFSIGDYKRVGGLDIYKYKNRYGYEDTDFFYRLRLGGVMPVRFQHEGLKHIAHAPLKGWSGVNTPHGEFHNCKGYGYIGEEDHLVAAGAAMWSRPLAQLNGI